MTHFSFKLKICWWSNLKYISTNFFGIIHVVVFWRNHLGWANFTHPLPTIGITINSQIHMSMYIWRKYIKFSCHDELSTKICIHDKITFDFKYVFFFSKTSTGDFVSKLYVYAYIMKRWFFKATSIKDAWTQLEVWHGVGTTAVPEKGALNSLNHFKIAKSLTFELYEYYLT